MQDYSAEFKEYATEVWDWTEGVKGEFYWARLNPELVPMAMV